MARAAGTPCHAIMGTHTHTPTSLANNSETLRVDPALRWRIIFGSAIRVTRDWCNGNHRTGICIWHCLYRDESASEWDPRSKQYPWQRGDHSFITFNGTSCERRWEVYIYIFLLLHQHVGCLRTESWSYKCSTCFYLSTFHFILHLDVLQLNFGIFSEG